MNWNTYFCISHISWKWISIICKNCLLCVCIRQSTKYRCIRLVLVDPCQHRDHSPLLSIASRAILDLLLNNKETIYVSKLCIYMQTFSSWKLTICLLLYKIQSIPIFLGFTFGKCGCCIVGLINDRVFYVATVTFCLGAAKIGPVEESCYWCWISSFYLLSSGSVWVFCGRKGDIDGCHNVYCWVGGMCMHI